MSSYNRYFSPAQVESDQKDLIVSQLKAEIFELRQNERDYHDLGSSLRSLEHKYNLLSEEKLRNEAEYKNRNDSNLKAIANLKTDIDIMKSTLAERNIEYQENKAENLAIKDIADHRSIDISKLKNELSGSIDQNNRLKEEKRNLESQLASVREEKRRNLSQFDASRSDFEELNHRAKELDRVLRELEYDRARVEKQQSQLQQSNEGLNIELRNKTETLHKVESQIAAADRDIRDIENEAAEVHHQNEKERADFAAKQRIHQQEVGKNLELNSRISNSESTLRARESQLNDLGKDIEHLNQVFNSQIKSNYALNDDLDDIKNQIDKFTIQNEELVAELEAFNREDEQIRGILNRRNRVNDLKHKSESQLTQSRRSHGSVERSVERRAASPNRSQRTPGPNYSQTRSPLSQRRY